MEFWGITDTGRVRARNQDAFDAAVCGVDGTVVLVVCDGMGGARAGDVASSVACETFMAEMKASADGQTDLSALSLRLARAVAAANGAVYARSLSDPEYAGMGTTLVAAVVSGEEAVIVNIGDSRAYRTSGGTIEQITRDHSVVEDMVTRGDITRLEARHHPHKNLITRALGSGRAEPPDIFEIKLDVDEYILLCTDGLTNMVGDEEIALELRGSTDVEASCRRLVALANHRGAPDNVTALLFKNSRSAPSAKEV